MYRLKAQTTFRHLRTHEKDAVFVRRWRDSYVGPQYTTHPSTLVLSNGLNRSK